MIERLAWMCMFFTGRVVYMGATGGVLVKGKRGGIE
jgi:hypothetical protein